MHIKVRTYKFTCDGCKMVEFVRDVPYCERPQGWTQEISRGHGLTGYDRDYDLCAICSQTKVSK